MADATPEAPSPAKEVLTPSEANRRIWQLAWPSILSELSTPLLGLVDTVVVGHLADVSDLSGVALSTAALNPLLFVFTCIRMGTGGITAQAFGAEDRRELMAGAARGICLGILGGTLLIFLCNPLASLVFACIKSTDEKTMDRALTYFHARILGGPAELANYAVQAWLIGVQQTHQALAANLVLNLSNAALCVLLGWVLNFGVAGVGAATALANYLALLFGIFQIWRESGRLPWLGDTAERASVDWALVWNLQKWLEMAVLNGNIFFRSLCLMLIFQDFTALSARFGSTFLAANNLLLQMQGLISFGSDGFANAAEALVGEAVGRGQPRQVRVVLMASLRWGALLGLGFTLTYLCCGRLILSALTWHRQVVDIAMEFLPWQWAAPLLSVTAYVMDGVFVGATQPRQMRDATCLALLGFLVVSHVFQGSNNWLWAAFLVHVIIRAVALLLWYPRVEAKAAASSLAEPLLVA